MGTYDGLVVGLCGARGLYLWVVGNSSRLVGWWKGILPGFSVWRLVGGSVFGMGGNVARVSVSRMASH
ncbi:MAG TPA: hypothetical protein VNG51_16710 [Ktedonobacteraceae bacterium]|nr:hypothetical protein [Ktedonobacteraceae bacterium]